MDLGFFSPDNKILVGIGFHGSVMVYNLQTKYTVVQRGPDNNYAWRVTEIHFSGSSRLVAATSTLPRVEVWDTDTGRLVKQEDRNLKDEELQDFIDSWERNLHLDENTESVDCKCLLRNGRTFVEICYFHR